MLKRMQRYETTRSPFMNDMFEILTLSELIDTVIMLNSDAPRLFNVDTKVGLYIEIKEYNEKKLIQKIDLAEMMHSVLDSHNLGTVADCKEIIPIVIQCFEREGL